jgi:hypothetical protein
MAERADTVVIFAGSNRRGQGISHPRQTLIIVVCHHIFKPEQMIWFHPTADLNGLIDIPKLVDITHKINIIANAATGCAHPFPTPASQTSVFHQSPVNQPPMGYPPAFL